MFNRNDVLNLRQVNYRLLGVCSGTAVLYPMASDSVSLEMVPEGELAAAEKEGAATLIDDPFLALQTKPPQGKALEKMTENYALIRPLIDLGEELLTNQRKRARVLSEIADGDASRRRRATRLLAAYWKKGQSEAALQPEYGHNTAPRNCIRKPGRRFRDPTICPPPLNEELRTFFRHIVERYMLRENGLSLAKAHAVLVNEYLEKHPEATKETAPSLNQFRYFYRNYKTFPERLQAKTPNLEYEKDKRALHGSIYDIVDGIGKVYEIDSTPADVFLVSSADRSRLLGRPTLYVVTDVYSRMIVGVHVAIETAQYSTAAAALCQAFSDKSEPLKKMAERLCGRDWDVSGLPYAITADNGELAGRQIEGICRSFGVQINNTKAYRGDQKGCVEKSLDLVQERLASVIDAKPCDKRLKKEGAVDRRPDATLTLEEYRMLVLNAVVDINNRALKITPPTYPYGSMPTPTEIWNWCRRPGGGKSYLRRAPQKDLLARALMPRFEATVSREGIRAEKLTYDCDRARQLGWFERDRGAPRPQERIYLAIDANNVGVAWVFETENTSPKDAWPCRLAATCQRFEGMALFEARAARDEQSAAYNAAKRDHAALQGKMLSRNEAIAKKAKAAKPKVKPDRKAQLEALAGNRREERGRQARLESQKGGQAVSKRVVVRPEPVNPYELPDDLEELDV